MTRNTFVFGIGGTGARVVRALTMILAAGVKLKDTNRTIPIILDVDATNGDTSRTLQTMESYNIVRQAGYGNVEDIKEGFFTANLSTLSSLRADGDNSVRLEDSFQLHFDNLETTFIKYIDPRGELVNNINGDLLQALYDDTPLDHELRDHTELNLNLSLGFRGNPNIGCVVFNDLARSKEFQFVIKSIGANDRIFIISSIFGGTGSAGFPQLVRLLREQEALKKNRIGALTVMPYYKVADKKGSSINSDRFEAKTQAALSYYGRYLKGKVDAFYHLDDTPLKTYDNNQGGKDQRNPAHVVEFLGATAIVDFINKADDAFKAKGQTAYYDFGVKNEDAVMDSRHFYDKTQQEILKPMTLFAFAMKIYLDWMPKNKKAIFFQELDMRKKNADPFHQHLEKIFTEYSAWLKEMIGNDRKFQPFNVDAELNLLVREKPIESSGIWLFKDKGITDGFLERRLGILEDELKKKIPEKEKNKRFLSLLNAIAEECFAKVEGLPTMA